MNRLVFSMFLILAGTFSFYTCGANGSPPTTPTQGDASAKPPAKALNLPADTVIIARFVANLDTAQCKLGDRIEAEVVHDVKVDHDTVIKRGARVIGHVAGAEPDASGTHGVWIVFDTIAAKNADPTTLHMDIQAISPPETSGAVAGLLIPVPANRSATEGPHGELTEDSKVVIRLPGVTLASRNANGMQITVLASSANNIHLVKGSQVVFRVLNPSS